MSVWTVGSRHAVLLLLAAWLGACTAAATNEPLATFSEDRSGPITTGGYRGWALPAGRSSDQLLIGLALSGGGKRSAAFSYGVLRGLKNYAIEIDGHQSTLLDQLDTIASVSGGSFTAAYYGLKRDKIFADFEHDFLKRDIESYIYGMYLLPWNWAWLVNPLYGTNDQMAKVYDDLMFHGATYADLIRNGKPFVSINATDIGYGIVFPFTQDQFDLICSDLASYPLARAVAASNGFPVLFTPITLNNYADKCGGREPPWVKRAFDVGPLSRERQLAEFARLYLDPRKTEYVHLMDGGISDNLAMRQMINTIFAYGENAAAVRRAGYDRVRRIMIISADGQASRDSSWPHQRIVTSLGQILNAVSGTQIDSYNFETLLLADQELRRTVEGLRRIRCAESRVIDGHPCDDVQAFLVHLSLDGISDATVREGLQRIPTGLTIPDEAVDQLVAAGESLVRDSTVLAEFRRSLAPSRTRQAASGTR
jgi:NTE family protein